MGNETEGRWLVLIFKADKDLIGGFIAEGMSSLWWLVSLEEEEWVGGWWMLVAEIRLEDLSFNSIRDWKNDKEMCYCELLFCSSMLELEDMRLNT